MDIDEVDYYASVDEQLREEMAEDAERDVDPPCHPDAVSAAREFCGCWR